MSELLKIQHEEIELTITDENNILGLTTIFEADEVVESELPEQAQEELKALHEFKL